MRERLGNFYQQTHYFTAYFTTYARTETGSNVVCLAAVMLDNKRVADHVWIHRSKQMKSLELQRGDLVAFEARVGRYCKREPQGCVGDLIFDYNLEKIRNMQVVKRRQWKDGDELEYLRD